MRCYLVLISQEESWGTKNEPPRHTLKNVPSLRATVQLAKEMGKELGERCLLLRSLSVGAIPPGEGRAETA